MRIELALNRRTGHYLTYSLWFTAKNFNVRLPSWVFEGVFDATDRERNRRKRADSQFNRNADRVQEQFLTH